MLRSLALLLLITRLSHAAPEALHVVYEQVGKTTTRLEITAEKGKATRTLTRDGKTETAPFDGTAALWSEIEKAKLFEWKPQTGPGAPDFGEVRLSAEATEAGKKSAAALSWNAPLRNDGPVWSLLNHLDTLMSGQPAPAPAPIEPPGGVPSGPPGPPASPIPTDPPTFMPAPASPAARPPAWPAVLGAPIPERPAPATTNADRIAALMAARSGAAADQAAPARAADRTMPAPARAADRTMPAPALAAATAPAVAGAAPDTAPALAAAAPGDAIQTERVQPAAIEALLASVATKLPLPLAPWEPAADPETAAALAKARRPSYEAARARLDAQLAARPANAELYTLRGAVRLELSDLPGALADFTRAATLQPHRADHRHNRAVIQTRLSNFAEARRDFEAAHRLSPARFQPAPLVLSGAAERTWLGRPGRHLRAPRENLR